LHIRIFPFPGFVAKNKIQGLIKVLNAVNVKTQETTAIGFPTRKLEMVGCSVHS
jgi:hypothetical protein